MVTSGGGVEEDIMKCFGSFYHGEFNLDGRDLRKSVNCFGNKKNIAIFSDSGFGELDTRMISP
jgi:deoxyhypusine synthase